MKGGVAIDVDEGAEVERERSHFPSLHRLCVKRVNTSRCVKHVNTFCVKRVNTFV